MSFLTTSTVCSDSVPCRSVAPCNRSWGSSRCRLVLSAARRPSVAAGPRRQGWARAFPVTPYPAKPSPRHQLCAVSPRPIPSRRYRRLELPARRCCHLYADRLCASARPQGLVPVPSPLPCPGVATWARLDPPLGAFLKTLYATCWRPGLREPPGLLTGCMSLGAAAPPKRRGVPGDPWPIARVMNVGSRAHTGWGAAQRWPKPARVAPRWRDGDQPKWVRILPGWVSRPGACRSRLLFSSPEVGESSRGLPKPAPVLVARGR